MRLTLGVLALVALLATAARADNDRKQARELYEQGTALYNVGEYRSALDKFKAAYLIVRDPVFLFNIGQCQRQLDDPAAAAASYKAYRRERPDAPNRVEVDRLIVEMEKAAKAAQERRNQPPVEVMKPSAPPPTATTTPTPPPPATQETVPSGTSSVPSGTSSVPSGTSSEPASTTLTATAPRRDKPVYKKAWFWGVVGAGAVVVAGAITLGVVLGTRDSSTLLPDARY
jgi:tetratricopeptide (TPR) repeat protein